MTNTPKLDRLDALVLARLSTRARTPPSRGDIVRSLRPYLDQALTAAEQRTHIDRTLASLQASGQVQPKPLSLTDTGRARLRQLLGTSEDLEWKVIRDRHLPAHSLGLPATERVRKRVARLHDLCGTILKVRQGLATREPTPTLSQAVDALVWRYLGVETGDRLDLGKIREHVLRQALGTERRMNKDKLAKMLAAKAIEVDRTDAQALRAGLVRAWIFAPDQPGKDDQTTLPARAPDSHRPDVRRTPRAVAERFDLGEFARTVNDAAQDEEHARFGERRVFISAIWRRMKDQPRYAGMSEAEFKAHLIQANRDDLVKLHRADLVAAMPAHEVAASETRHLNATFHFVEPPPRSPTT